MTVPASDLATVFGMALTNPESTKFLTKLVETVGNGLGLLYEPVRIRRKAKAEAEVAIGKAKAEANIALIKAKSKTDIALMQINDRALIREATDRAEVRVTRREEQRQQNLEAIVAKAALGGPETVSDKPVEKDWVARFIDDGQDVSDEEMQSIWARILAGEVCKPGSFSLRTLAVVRTMSKKDAELFTRFCSIVWEWDELGTRSLRPLTYRTELLQSMPGIGLGILEFTRLDSMGLIRMDTRISHYVSYKLRIDKTVPDGSAEIPFHWYYHGKHYVFRKMVEIKPSNLAEDQPFQEVIMQFPTGEILLTDVGYELAWIAGSEPNEDYLKPIVDPRFRTTR
jgi:hypothetical protein